ncbi:MAG: hypothetical protein AAF711_00640 [Planctomycetota bacterium]
MPIKLAQLEDLQARLDVSAENDLLNGLLEAVSAMCAQARFAGVDLRRTAGIVEYPVAEYASNRLRVGRYPIESITEVKTLYTLGNDAEFDAADALVENEDYAIESSTFGVLIRAYGCWQSGPRRQRITYTAGFGDPAALNAGELEPPIDLQHGILQQCVFLHNTLGTAGLQELNAGGQGGKVKLSESKPHADLVAACATLRRLDV